MSIANKDATDQGPGGSGGKTRPTGSPRDVGPANGFPTPKSNGSHMEPNKANNVPTPKANSASHNAHREPAPGLTHEGTSVRGGGTTKGHTRDPGPKSSGSKNQQHPNVKR